jgi:hypothetical protein
MRAGLHVHLPFLCIKRNWKKTMSFLFFSYLASRERNTRLSVSRDQVVVENLASAAFCVLHARGENKRVVPLFQERKKKTKASSSLRTMKIPRHPGWLDGRLAGCQYALPHCHDHPLICTTCMDCSSWLLHCHKYSFQAFFYLLLFLYTCGQSVLVWQTHILHIIIYMP